MNTLHQRLLRKETTEVKQNEFYDTTPEPHVSISPSLVYIDIAAANHHTVLYCHSDKQRTLKFICVREYFSEHKHVLWYNTGL